MRVLVALMLAAIAAPPASAQEDGVFVDPDSPAGKEYAVPLDEARREAAGASVGGTSRRGDALPLFGVGIQRRSKPSAAGTIAPAQERRSEAQTGASRPEAVAPSGQNAAVIEAAASDGSGGLLAAGIAAGVLAAGLLGGLGLRRLLRES